MFPDDIPKPNASNLNFVPGETVPNLAIVRVPANGVVKFYNCSGTRTSSSTSSGTSTTTKPTTQAW